MLARWLAVAALGLGALRAEPVIDVWLIGDSTMADKVDPDINPEHGWGQLLPLYFAPNVHVHNRAQNGRSTKSFIDEGRWRAVTDSLKRGDYVLIEFGHNDEKSEDPARYAAPHGAYRQNLERFIADARAKGAIPVLLTPIVRRKFDAAGTLAQTHGDYPEVVRQIAGATHVAFIDLEALTRKLVQAAGPEGSKQIYDWAPPHTWPLAPAGKQDDTHLSLDGATKVAGLAAAALRDLHLPISPFVNSTPRPDPTPRGRALWNGAAPGAVGDSSVDWPTITPYLPPNVKSTAPVNAVIVFPGGGYDHLSTDKEGVQPAHWLNSRGVAALVVRYRVGPRYHFPAIADDAAQAMRMARDSADAWHIDPHRIGVMGFSAGGHLASYLGTTADSALRPAYMLLVYPVITMDDRYAHKGSRAMLLGADPSPEPMKALSTDTRVTKQTPPTFIVAGSDDASVPVQNSLLFYEALRSNGVPAELHLLETGRHGFGMGAGDPYVSAWPSLAQRWLTRHGWCRCE